jgi:hypothetical protein
MFVSLVLCNLYVPGNTDSVAVGFHGLLSLNPTSLLFLIVVECILLLYVINKILIFIPYSQLVLCLYSLYSLYHNMFRLHRAIFR